MPTGKIGKIIRLNKILVELKTSKLKKKGNFAKLIIRK
jgi:hypothetical protein